MPQYALRAGSWTAATLPAQIGNTYNIGLSDGTHYYGYCFKNDGQSPMAFTEKTNTTDKETLIQYSSGQLIDRDLAYFPRVTDGDFSGGGYQEVWIDPTKYFDSDLDPHVPGYLQLRPQWARVSKTGLTIVAGAQFQVVAWSGDFWFTLGEANGNVYSSHGGTTTSPTAAAVVGLDTDGQYLYAGTGSALFRTSNGSTWTPVASALNVTAARWWVFNEGTSGWFAYYTTGTSNTLYKIDLTLGFPIAAASQPQVPTGSNQFLVLDLAWWQNGLAVLTTDPAGTSQQNSDVWFHDGTNLTKIVALPGYSARGLCTCLGNLFVGLQAATTNTSPILAQVSGGQYTVVAKPGSPFFAANQTCLGPRSSGQYVYWPILNHSINGISAAKGVVIEYDVLSGAVTHLPNFDATDYATASANGLKAVAAIGDSIAICYVNGTDGILQYQSTAWGANLYMTSGWLVSSHIDFGTPGIVKRFRRIEVHHAPLNVNESITVEGFVDVDPLSFTTALTPVPATATAVNTTVGTSLTAMTFGADTVGKTMYFAIKLACSSGVSTPRLSYVSVEVGGTWVWQFELDCTSKRRTLAQSDEDPQGVNGKDLRFLVRNAYENGANLTLYIFGTTYTVAVESEEAHSAPYANHAGAPVKADEEWISKVVLRQVA